MKEPVKTNACFSWDLERLANMPDLRNGSLEGEQYLEELQVPPSSCGSLKNSSLLRPLRRGLAVSPTLRWGQCGVTASSSGEDGSGFRRGICWVRWE